MFRTNSVAMYLMVYVYISYCSVLGYVKKPDYEVVLESMQNCKDPNPPYTKKATIIPVYKVNVINGKKYLSGKSTITEPTPFLNFSTRTFYVDRNGQRVIKFQTSQVSCWNFFARSVLLFSNVAISTKNCMILKGYHEYNNLDLDKISHSLPGWYTPGDAIIQMQLVSRGATDFCSELHINIIKKPTDFIII